MKGKKELFTIRLSKSISDVEAAELSILHAKYQSSLRKCLENIETSAKEKTPVKTGRLKRGFKVFLSGKYPRLSASIRNPVPYFSFIEHGRKISYKKKLDKTKVQPNVPASQRNKVLGVKMLARSIDEHRSEIDLLERDFTREFLSIIKTKKL